MINPVGFNNVYSQRPVAYQPQVQNQFHPNFKGEEVKKEGMSKTKKILLGLGALGLAAGALLLRKKPTKINVLEDLTKEKFVDFVTKRQAALGEAYVGEGVKCLNKTKMKEFIEKYPGAFSDKLSRAIPKMSDNGFVMIFENVDKKTVGTTFIDPKTISFSELADAFATKGILSVKLK